jgi:hypothetical protein
MDCSGLASLQNQTPERYFMNSETTGYPVQTRGVEDDRKKPPNLEETEAGETALSSDSSETVPVLPVRGIVLFPHTIVPLTIGRPAALKLVETELPENKHLGIVTQIDEEKEQPRPEDLYPGTGRKTFTSTGWCGRFDRPGSQPGRI